MQYIYNMETIIVTGGTGLLGTALVSVLTEQGYEVIILTRKRLQQPLSTNINYAIWDVESGTIDKDALLKADHIIHLAGAGVVDKKWTAAYKKEIVDSRTKSAALIIDSLATLNHKVKTFVSASAIGWYGPDLQPNKAFTETDPVNSSFLGKTCQLWEESVNAAAALGIRVCCIRIGILLSKKGGAYVEYARPIKSGIACILGSGKQMVSWIHIDDICRIFLQALQNQDMTGSYNAVAPEPVNNKTLIVTIAEGIKGKFYIPVYVPSFVLKLMMGDRSIEVLKSTTVSCSKLKATGFTFLYPSLQSAVHQITQV